MSNPTGDALAAQRRDLVKTFEGHPIVEAWSTGYDAGVAAGRALRATFVTRAAEILEREAATLRESNTYLAGPHEGEWTEATAHLDHDEMVRVACELREAGK